MAAEHNASGPERVTPRVPTGQFPTRIALVTLSVSHRYRSPLVDIHDFACSAPAGHCSGEEAAAADEIAIVRRGVFVKHAADGKHVIDPTRVAVFRQNQPYLVDHPGEHGDHSTVLAFAPDVLQAAMADPAADGASTFATLPSAIPVDRELLLAFHRLLVALHQQPVDELLVDECALQALDAFHTAVMKVVHRRQQSGTENDMAARACTLLAERWSSRLTLDRLASDIGVSPFHLCRRFRAATGTTIHRYLTTLRMAAALERLGDYRNDLARLALDLGYSSHSHFTTTFSAWFGLPPSAAAAGRRFPVERKNPEAPATTMQ